MNTIIVKKMYNEQLKCEFWYAKQDSHKELFGEDFILTPFSATASFELVKKILSKNNNNAIVEQQ